jgi:hypothetical protein
VTICQFAEDLKQISFIFHCRTSPAITPFSGQKRKSSEEYLNIARTPRQEAKSLFFGLPKCVEESDLSESETESVAESEMASIDTPSKRRKRWTKREDWW